MSMSFQEFTSDSSEPVHDLFGSEPSADFSVHHYLSLKIGQHVRSVELKGIPANIRINGNSAILRTTRTWRKCCT